MEQLEKRVRALEDYVATHEGETAILKADFAAMRPGLQTLLARPRPNGARRAIFGAALTIIVATGGALANRVITNTSRIDRLETQMEAQTEQYKEIKAALIRIEERLNRREGK